MSYLLTGLLIVFVLVLTLIGTLVYRQRRGQNRAKRTWQSRSVPTLQDVGTTESLRILPLVNWHASEGDLRTEAGVSYLVQTDTNTILYDLGFNYNSESPSPLEHNMNELEVSLDNIDSIFLSHNHPDHAGGLTWSRRNTFSLGNEQVALTDKNLFMPTDEMTYPDAGVTVTNTPQCLLKGVATIGTIPRQLFPGYVQEQALAVHLEGKGMVVIVGCSHQTLPKILQRTDELFDPPLYGIVGDLHFPVPEGRLKILGLDVQRRLASGRGPLNPLNWETAREYIDRLAEYAPKLVGLGGHDTSDRAIDYCREQFGDAYEPIRVGRPIDV